MPEPAEPIVAIPEEECWALVASRTLGRLVTCIADFPEIFPVNFVAQRKTILFRTAEGTKLIAAAMNNRVAFEVDDHNVEQGWSVIVKGRAQVLRSDDEIGEAERAQLLPWTANVKRHYVRITPSEITGRRFIFGTAPNI